MKAISILLILLLRISFCDAQYNKDKLTNILTGGSTRAWTVKGSGASPEKTYTFNKNQTVEVGKETQKWELNSTDNIRWFIVIGNQKNELIVSYDKSGKQYVKLTNQGDDGKSLTHIETILYPLK